MRAVVTLSPQELEAVVKEGVMRLVDPLKLAPLKSFRLRFDVGSYDVKSAVIEIETDDP